jgi:hypothetical protein
VYLGLDHDAADSDPDDENLSFASARATEEQAQNPAVYGGLHSSNANWEMAALVSGGI